MEHKKTSKVSQVERRKGLKEKKKTDETNGNK